VNIEDFLRQSVPTLSNKPAEQGLRVMNTLKGTCAVALLFGLVACGGGNSSPPPTPTPTPQASSVKIAPGSAVVALSAAQIFSATNIQGTPVNVNWSISPGGVGTFQPSSTTASFQAPASFPATHTATITATLQSDTTQTATASVTVAFPNDNHLSEASPVKLGTTGGNATDISGRTCCSGTLGSLVTRGGAFFILSNNHVLDKSDQGAVGDAITQPGLVDNNCNPGNVVAHMSQAAPLKPSPCTGTCTGPAPSNVDAAIAQIVAGQVDTSGSILDLGAAGSSSIAAAPPSATLAVPAAVLASNEGVAKSGRTSGLTCSTLQSISTTVSVDYSASCGGPTAFTSTYSNQVIINGGSFSAGGDSGSLVVTSDKAQPLGLLFGGNSTSTSANPILDVLNAFKSGANNATMVGGGDHAVSCDPTASSPSAGPSPGTTAAELSIQENLRVADVRAKQSPMLLQDSAIASVEIGASEDSPGEGALVIHLSAAPKTRIPPVIDGVRTKIVSQNAGRAQAPVLASGDIEQTIAVKESHAGALMSQPGIQGVGVGRSEDNPSETAVVIYVVSGQDHPPIPQMLDGVRTKIVEGDRFRAFDWGKQTKPAAKCKK
jgi:hypothetical protein